MKNNFDNAFLLSETENKNFQIVFTHQVALQQLKWNDKLAIKNWHHLY